MSDVPVLRPEIKRVLLQKYKENTSGEITALNAVSSIFCDFVKSYPPNTKGVIQAILQLGKCLGEWAESVEDRLPGNGLPGGGGGGGSVGDLCCLLPQTPNVDYGSGGIISEDCGTENCLPTPHPHPHDPLDPCCGSSPDVNPKWKYPLGGIECLHPDAYEFVNAGLVGMYCEKTHAEPDCVIPSRVPYDNAGVIGCGDPTALHWVDYYWPGPKDWCNAGFTGHNCTECEDPLLVARPVPGKDCEVCRRGGAENYKPEFIEYDNAGIWGDDCPSAWARPTCMLPAGSRYCCYDNAGVVGWGDPDTDNYVDYFFPSRCEYLNSGLIGTGCAIGGDEWLDALDLPVEPGQCYAPYLAEYNQSGVMGGTWTCDTNTKPNTTEYYFDPGWGDFLNAGLVLVDDTAVYEDVAGGVECWVPIDVEFEQAGFFSALCPDENAPPGCLIPDCGAYNNGGVLAFGEGAITDDWWQAYWPQSCRDYENGGITGSNCAEVEDPPDHCDQPGILLPKEPKRCFTPECWLPLDCELFRNAGLRSSRDCNVCDECSNTDPNGKPVVVVSDSAPPQPCEGTLWFNPDHLNTMVYFCDSDSCQWVPASTPLGGTGGAQAIVSDSPPPGAVCGSLWHDSVRQETRIFYDDGNTKQWVPVSLAKANSTETETLMRRELDQLKSEIAALKIALAGRAPT